MTDRAAGPTAGAAGRTWRGLLAEAASRLGSDVDARRIVERTTGWDGTELHPHLDEAVPDRAIPFFDNMVERRAAGEPLQYVTGRWGFRLLDLLVDRRVLIPRPETEVVVEVALAALRAMEPIEPVVVDLGTGSGAIALSVATEVADARVWAVDISADALAVAGANLAGAGTFVAPRVQLVQGSWFDALPDELRGQVDLVVSNPPYVADHEELPPEVDGWEPRQALRAGPTGLECVERILVDAPTWLARPGLLVTEIAPHQADTVANLATSAGFGPIAIRPDLAGRPRVLVAHLKP